MILIYTEYDPLTKETKKFELVEEPYKCHMRIRCDANEFRERNAAYVDRKKASHFVNSE